VPSGPLWHGGPLRAFQRLLRKLVLPFRAECVLLGGGTFINRSEKKLKDYRVLVERLQKPVPTFGTGVASHEYWRGEPGWHDRRQEWLRLLRKLPVVGVRGPLSKQFLEEAGACNVVISGDPAVMFHEPPDDACKASHAHGSLRLAVNYGLAGHRFWCGQDELDEIMVALLRRLHGKGVQLQMVPVWRKDVPVCERVVLASGVPDLHVTPKTDHAEAYMQTIRNCHAVLTLKLHAAILAACANVPFIMIPYRPKCLDFAGSIRWEQYIVRRNSLTEENLFNLCMSAMESSPQLSREIGGEMAALKTRFNNYCQQVLRPLLLN